MILLFIYGPPATGKLTIAQEIAKKIDFRLFHNHLTLNLARQIYPEYGRQLIKLTHRIRLAAFDYSASQNTSLVFTNVYTGDKDDKTFVSKTR